MCAERVNCRSNALDNRLNDAVKIKFYALANKTNAGNKMYWYLFLSTAISVTFMQSGKIRINAAFLAYSIVSHITYGLICKGVFKLIDPK